MKTYIITDDNFSNQPDETISSQPKKMIHYLVQLPHRLAALETAAILGVYASAQAAQNAERLALREALMNQPDDTWFEICDENGRLTDRPGGEMVPASLLATVRQEAALLKQPRTPMLLREIRKRLGLTQTEFHRWLVSDAPKTFRTVADWERGVREIPGWVWEMIAVKGAI